MRWLLFKFVIRMLVLVICIPTVIIATYFLEPVIGPWALITMPIGGIIFGLAIGAGGGGRQTSYDRKNEEFIYGETTMTAFHRGEDMLSDPLYSDVPGNMFHRDI